MKKRAKRNREYLLFLRWLEQGPPPWFKSGRRYWEYLWERMKEQERLGLRARVEGYVEGITGAANKEDYVLQKAFWYAKRMQYVEIQQKGDRCLLALTDRGRCKLLQENLGQAPDLPKGTYLLVLFDIPETHYRLRHELRYLLKESGFKRLQLSVWYTDKDVRANFRELICYLGLESWVQVCLADFGIGEPVPSESGFIWSLKKVSKK